MAEQLYTCPMHPEVIKNAPGKCPLCGMNLVLQGKGEGHFHSHQHVVAQPTTEGGSGLYYCRMLCEGDKTYAEPGDCPVCGMHLVKKQDGGAEAPTPKVAPLPIVRKKNPGLY